MVESGIIPPLPCAGPDVATPTKSPDSDVRRLIVRGILGALVVAGLLALVSAVAAQPVEQVTQWITRALGLPGIAAGLILGEGTPLPIPGDAWLLAVAAGDGCVLAHGLTLGASSVVAGTIAYRLGPVFARLPLLRRAAAEHRARGEKFFAKYGWWAVALGSVTPLPYALLCWTAGACRMPYRRFLAATLLRIPRFVFFLFLFRLGWQSFLG